MISVASCDQLRGISASFISKTTLPSGLEIRLVRFSYSTASNGFDRFGESSIDLHDGGNPSQNFIPAYLPKWCPLNVNSIKINPILMSLNPGKIQIAMMPSTVRTATTL